MNCGVAWKSAVDGCNWPINPLAVSLVLKRGLFKPSTWVSAVEASKSRRHNSGNSDGVAGHIKTMNMQPYFQERCSPDASGCWQWTLTVRKDGYGLCRRFGKIQYAHRLSYQMHVGDIPVGLGVLHDCDNPRCVNPEHLFLGTQKDNMQDASRKGRNTRLFGKSNGMYRNGRYVCRAP